MQLQINKLALSLFSLGFGLSFAVVGCNSSIPSTESDSKRSTAKPLSVLSTAQQTQKDLAIKAKDKLFESLLGELTQSMGENGPAKSIDVCKQRAPEIAKNVGEETGVRIGRTSFQLRNENNKAPEWAASFVSDKIEKPIEVELPNDGLGVLLPIRLKAACTLCHGDAKQISPDVKTAIASNYPNDTATGFAEGDVRGYFWVEVDKQTSKSK